MNITVSVGTLFAVDFEILEAEMTGCVLETKILVLEVTPFGILKISAYLCEWPRGFEIFEHCCHHHIFLPTDPVE